MDTWMVARLIVDGAFAVSIVTVLAVFLYRREKKLRALIAQHVLNQVAAPVDSPPIFETAPAAAVPSSVVGRGARPTLMAQYDAQTRPQPATRMPKKMTRAEKYLEAVRMYRSGSRRDEIERTLGISFMELELLGQVK